MENRYIKRDYSKDNSRQKEINKRYTVKVPLYEAKALDEKLKKDNETWSSFARKAIEKYLKK